MHVAALWCERLISSKGLVSHRSAHRKCIVAICEEGSNEGSQKWQRAVDGDDDNLSGCGTGIAWNWRNRWRIEASDSKELNRGGDSFEDPHRLRFDFLNGCIAAILRRSFWLQVQIGPSRYGITRTLPYSMLHGQVYPEQVAKIDNGEDHCKKQNRVQREFNYSHTLLSLGWRGCLWLLMVVHHILRKDGQALNLTQFRRIRHHKSMQRRAIDNSHSWWKDPPVS